MKVQGKREPVHTSWVQQFCDIFGKKRDAWHMILEDNPARHSFVLRDLVLIELFQISQNCVTECTLQAIAIRDFCGISRYVIFLSNRRVKFKL